MLDSSIDSETTRQWYALRSKPKKELFAASQLEKAGIEVYVPQVKVHRQHGKPAALEPLFPSYFFGRLDQRRAEIHLARYTPGVLYVVGYGDEAWPVPDNLILAIQHRLAGRRGQAGPAGLRSGDRVVVTSGPLAGVEAIFDRSLSPTGRVHVLIQILQRACRTELQASQLRRVS